MPDPHPYDLIVIGAGPAGEKGAVTAATLGKKVAIIEKCAVVGGAGVNTGTLPSKTLRETALALNGIRARKLYGVDLSLRREATVADFLFHERRVQDSQQGRIRTTLDRSGVELVFGTASFVDAHTIRVSGCDGETSLQAGTILIAIGSAPSRPAEFPFEHPRVHDSDEIVNIRELPRSLAVIGAGVIGSEYACTFAALGCQVQVIDGRDVLMPFLDLEIAEALTAAMMQSGVAFHWKERVASCQAPDQGAIVLTLSSGKTVAVDQVLVAAGRVSHTDALNLQAAGITPGKRGLIDVNDRFQTSVDHIYAAGDVIGFPALASTSMEQARIAVCHAFGAPIELSMAPCLPSGIYTIPEVGMIGETEGSLKGKGIDYVAGRARYAQNARGAIIGDESGFLKLLFRRDDMKLLGAHVIGEGATELVHIGATALLADAGAELFVQQCFNYPTLSELYKTAALDAVIKKLGLAS